ncbi:hypothetical protein HK100_006192 [Physocladia obscura]|uniref:Major facilitator superfamily (MFS) profile domain-containing protein n=1 Tax=Physocladia obscura TaxID=109957 RepID=A0AAD5T813_9FUNG|nr:hypothetical protein HK100_006192 [Physocladia obscura]
MLLAYSNFFDILGPRFALILALGIYDVGSLICGLAQSMQMLILGRIVSGLGGGGIISMYFLITPNIISFQDDILMYYETGSIFGGFTGWILGISAIAVPSLGAVDDVHCRLVRHGVTSGGAMHTSQRNTARGEHKFAVEVAASDITVYYDSAADILFFQFNFNDSSLLAGVFIIPMLVGLFCAVVLAKWYISKYAILIGGLVLISLMDDQSSVTERIGNMFVFGFGGGIGAFARTKSAEGVLQPRTSKKLSALALGFVMLGSKKHSAISIAMTGTIVKNEILKSIDTLSPVYTDAVKILALQNITVDVVDIFVTINSFDIASLNAVQSGNNTLVEIFDTARMNVLVMFNSSFRIAFLWLIPFPVVMMLAAPWIPQETDSDSDITT